MATTPSIELDPVVEADKLSDTVSKLAFDTHGVDQEKAEKFIKSIICGTTNWSEATRGLAVAKYSILFIESKGG